MGAKLSIESARQLDKQLYVNNTSARLDVPSLVFRWQEVNEGEKIEASICRYVEITHWLGKNYAAEGVISASPAIQSGLWASEVWWGRAASSMVLVRGFYLANDGDLDDPVYRARAKSSSALYGEAAIICICEVKH